LKALEYGRYNINRYHFWTVKLEASHPFAVTTNSIVVPNNKDASGLAANYYGVLQKINEHTFGGTKELKVVFFECDWFDPVNSTRVDDFGMVEVKHKLRYSSNNILFAHQAQQVYYLSYPHESMKHLWLVDKVNPEMDTRRYDAYRERHDDDDIIFVYQVENKGHQSLNFIVSNGARLAELATRDVELMENNQVLQRNTFRNQNDSLKNKKGVNDLMHMLLKQIQILTTYDKYNLLLSLYIYLKICY
jgi:hypothetical protein